MTEQRIVQFGISAGALVALALHKREAVKLDTTTLVLLGLVVLPWMVSLIKSIELPGGYKLELQELKSKVREASGAAEDAGREASRAKKELNDLAVYVFQCVINKKEAKILKALEESAPYRLDRVGEGVRNSLYQLRDTGLITMKDIGDLSGPVPDLHEKAQITDLGRGYLEHLRRIEDKRSKK